jgi:hypothetical protein
MPSGKMIAWIVALSLASTLALESYKNRSAGAKPTVLRRSA